MINIDPQEVWNNIMKNVQKTGNITEYDSEIICAMKKYAGLCINELITEDKLKYSDLTSYMQFRVEVDKLTHSQV